MGSPPPRRSGPAAATRQPRPGWLQGRDGIAYPPEPWHLGGTILVSAFRLPVTKLPEAAGSAFPPDAGPLVVGGHALLGVAFARYTPGGVLAYDELLVALVGLHRAAPRYTIPQIWVDSAESRAGARELWGIPKEFAAFERRVEAGVIHTTMRIGGEPVASLRARPGRSALPGLRQIPLTTAQRLDGRSMVSRSRVVARVKTLHADWTFEPDGPLGYLAGTRAWFSVALLDAAVVFGMDVERS